MTALISRETKTFTNSGAIGPYIRVTLSAGVLAIAGATDPGIGVMETRALAADLTGTVRLRRKGDTIRMTAGGAIAQYAKVYPAASGKIDDVASGAALGIALEAASGDGSVIEVLSMDDAIRCVGGQATTVAASDTIVTGLGTLISAVACLDDSPSDDPIMATASIGDQAGTPAAGSFLLKTWKDTGGTDPTPAAASTFTKKVNWLAWGY